MIAMDKQVECPQCHGVGGGRCRDGIEVDCSTCWGTGSIAESKLAKMRQERADIWGFDSATGDA